MNQMNHTRGPWECYADLPSADENWHIVTGAKRMRVVANVHIEPGNVMDEANARLINAAPELLQALQDMLRTLMDGPDDSDVARVIDKARAAIAKATGAAQ